jgi:hypothetical protein
MLNRLKITLAVLLALGASAMVGAQTNAPADPGNPTPTFRVNVVSRSTPAVNYDHRGGSTKINFKGTELVFGAATVQSERGESNRESRFARPGSLLR